MMPQLVKINHFEVTYFNKEELDILKEEIFQKEIYHIKLDSNSPTILDVGSHIGLSILYFKLLYPNSKITAFEPNPNIFPLLEENIYLNNIKDVKLHNIALGKEFRQRELYIDASGGGAFSTSSFYKNAWNGKQKTLPIEVKVEKLSKYIDRNIDLLKIDTEGAELEILEELEERDKLRYIKNIALEFHPTNKNKYQKIKKLLSRNSFQLKENREDREGLVLIIGKKAS